MASFRLSGIYLDLSRLLASVIRNNLKFQVLPMTECWTFDHVCNWQINDKKHPYDQGGNGYEALYPVEHEQSLYFGAGRFSVAKDSRCEYDDLDRFEIRTVCELSEWVPVGQYFWTVRAWVKHPNGSITKHCFKKFSFESSAEEIEVPKNMRDLPPKKIAFKPRKEFVA